MKKLSSILIVFMILFSFICKNAQTKDTMDAYSLFYERYKKIFKEVATIINKNKGLSKSLYDRITNKTISESIIFNTSKVQNFFSKNEEGLILSEIENWCIKDNEINCNFFYYQKNSPKKIQLVVPECIAHLPKAKFLYYALFFQTITNISPDFCHQEPSILLSGISSLIAQEINYRTNLSLSSNHALEASFVNLLYLFDSDILNKIFNDQYSDYRNLLIETIAKMNNRNDERNAIFADFLLKKKKIKFDYKKFVQMLPDNHEQIDTLIKKVNTDITNITRKCLLINALYDRKVQLYFGSTNPAQWIKKMIDSSPKKRPRFYNNLGKKKDLLFENFQSFSEKNSQEIPISQISFDPNLIKWLFTFLYNYSEEIALHNDTLSKAAAAGEKIEITPEIFLEILNKDSFIRKIFLIIGNPITTIHPIKNENNGFSISLEWKFLRYLTKDVEFAKVCIKQSYGTGGGGAGAKIDGVHQETKILVKKNNHANPEIIPLSQVIPGYCVQTIDQWDNAQYLWARVIDSYKASCNHFYKTESGKRQLITSSDQMVLSKSNNDVWKWKKSSTLIEYMDQTLNNDRVVPDSCFVSNNNQFQDDNKIIQLEILSFKQPAYFAGSSLVKTKAKLLYDMIGISGESTIDTPNGSILIKNLKKGDYIYSYDIKTSETCLSIIKDIAVKNVDEYISIQYTSENNHIGKMNSSKSQEFLILNEQNQIDVVPAIMLAEKNQLISKVNRNGSIKTITIVSVKEVHNNLKIYDLKISEPGIVKINKSMTIVRHQIDISDGIYEDSIIQLAPGEEQFQHLSHKIDISKPDTLTMPVQSIRKEKQHQALNYKVFGENNYFYKEQIRYVNKISSTRYLKIKVGDRYLNLGHLQELPVIKKEDKIKKSVICEARELEVGDKVFVLQKKDFKIFSYKIFEYKSYVESQEISEIQEIFSNKGPVTMIQLDYISQNNTGMYRSPEIAKQLRNIFANNILIILDPADAPATHSLYSGFFTDQQKKLMEMHCGNTTIDDMRRNIEGDGRGSKYRGNGIMGWGNGIGTGNNGQSIGNIGEGKGTSKEGVIDSPSKRFITNKFYDDYYGKILNEKQNYIIKFNDEDYQQFEKQLNHLKRCWVKIKNNKAGNENRLKKFLAARYEFVNEKNIPIQFNTKKEIRRLLNHMFNKMKTENIQTYLDFRKLYIRGAGTGVISALIKEYIFIAYYLYETQQNKIADQITIDMLTIIGRSLNKENSGEFYRDPSFYIRDVLIYIKDLLQFVRNNNTVNEWDIQFTTIGWSDVIQSFIDSKIIGKDVVIYKDHNTQDVPDVKLQRLIIKLDKQFNYSKRDIPQSILCKYNDPNKFLSDDRFTDQFKIKQETHIRIKYDTLNIKR